MILCPHGCGVRLHPSIDDGEHDAVCALKATPATVSNRPTTIGRNSQPMLFFVPKLFHPRSAEARDWAAFAAAAMTGLVAAQFERSDTLDYAQRAGELADDLFAEYQRRAIEPEPKASPTPAEAAAKAKRPPNAR